MHNQGVEKSDCLGEESIAETVGGGADVPVPLAGEGRVHEMGNRGHSQCW